MLRDPVQRYLSEYHHVYRHGIWIDSKHTCNGRRADKSEIQRCSKGKNWFGMELQEFMNCPFNMANNRQTRMLADLTLVNCYNKTGMRQAERDRIMLESAKDNLQKMAYIGLTEFQAESQMLFEQTFNLRFTKPFLKTKTFASNQELNPEQLLQIQKLNHLDIELYKFALELFQSHMTTLIARKPELKITYKNMTFN